MGKQIQARHLLEMGCDEYERGRRKKAIALFEQAARLGNPFAQNNLANLYDSGKGVTLSRSRARQLYRRAASHGVAEAAYNLAISYQYTGDRRWVKYWMARAARMGDKDASAAMKKLAAGSASDSIQARKRSRG